MKLCPRLSEGKFASIHFHRLSKPRRASTHHVLCRGLHLSIRVEKFAHFMTSKLMSESAM